jgi:hypothetical protein
VEAPAFYARRRLMLREEKIKLVETYLESLLNKDLSKVSLADNVTFEGPRMPRLTGPQSVLGFLQKIMFPAVKNIRVKQHIVEGDYVATVFDMETTDGVDHVFDLIHVLDGQISGIQAFYYPQQRSK